MDKKEKWTTVMIKKSTRAKLHEVQRLFESQALKGQLPDCPRHDRFGISMDTVIQILLERDNKHRERGRRNSPPTDRQEGQGEESGTTAGQHPQDSADVIIL
jgi:hypothetical protein